MLRMSGYFLFASKSGGFWIHAWIFLPSKLVYQISSGSVRFSLENNRSEEHTSELQSLTNIVCRLLLEKKKKQRIHDNTLLISYARRSFITTQLLLIGTETPTI